MDDSQLNERILELLQQPGRSSYLALWEIVTRSADYQPYSDGLRFANELASEERWVEAIEAAHATMPNLLLSPRAHLLLAYLYDQLGNDRGVQMEVLFAQACLEGILDTGNGTAEAPYLVTRTSDEYDVLEHLEKTFTQQALCEQGNRHFDVLTCGDGSELWFDITEPYSRLSGQRSRE
ncbi:MAG: DUF4919 domain-containing protein [Planctomycetaceae bacterium]|nr:DUF4919 domain-containing protein [Planctomycetaceae bacterium]